MRPAFFCVKEKKILCTSICWTGAQEREESIYRIYRLPHTVTHAEKAKTSRSQNWKIGARKRFCRSVHGSEIRGTIQLLLPLRCMCLTQDLDSRASLFFTVTLTSPCWWSLCAPLVRLQGLWRTRGRCRTASRHRLHVDSSSPRSAPSAGLPRLGLGTGFLWKERTEMSILLV